MAGDDGQKSQPADTLCKYCGNKVVKGVYCTCNGCAYHPSCGERVKQCCDMPLNIVISKTKARKQSEGKQAETTVSDDVAVENGEEKKLKTLQSKRETQNEIEKYTLEIKYLKQLVKEVNDKNEILKENNKLLLDRVHLLEGAKNVNKRRTRNVSEGMGRQGTVNRTRMASGCESEGQDGVGHCRQSAELKVGAPSFQNQHLQNSQKLPNRGKIDTRDNDVYLSLSKKGTAEMERKKEIVERMDIEKEGVQLPEIYRCNETSVLPAVNASVNVDADINDVTDENSSRNVNKAWDVVFPQRIKGDDDWHEVRSKKGGRRASRPTQDRPEPALGTRREDCGLRVAPKLSGVFLSGFDQGTKADDLLKFLEDNNLREGCSCERMDAVKGRRVGSFKLLVPISNKEKIMSPELWPEGVVINHFLNLQRRRYIGGRPGNQMGLH